MSYAKKAIFITYTAVSFFIVIETAEIKTYTIGISQAKALNQLFTTFYLLHTF